MAIELGHRMLRGCGQRPPPETRLAIRLGGKPATRPERLALREAVRWIPLNRLLLETDTYPLPGRATEPRDIHVVCQTVADLKGLSFETVAEATTSNYLRLFYRKPAGR